MENQVRLIPREIREANFPVARFLSDEEQERYEDSIKQFSGRAYNSLNIPEDSSNLFKVLYLNQIGIQTITMPQLEDALENGMQLGGYYEDSPSVVLRSNNDPYEPNDYLAKQLANLIGQKEFKHPLILNGLELKADEDSSYGLSFKRGEKFEMIEAPDFDYANNGERFSRINPNYTIEWDNQGDRTFYVRDSGLSRLYLGRSLDVDSYVDDLAYSDDKCLVVVISAEGADEK